MVALHEIIALRGLFRAHKDSLLTSWPKNAKKHLNEIYVILQKLQYYNVNLYYDSKNLAFLNLLMLMQSDTLLFIMTLQQCDVSVR